MSIFCLLMYLIPYSFSEPSPEVQKQIDDIMSRLLNATKEPPKEMPYYFNKA